MRNDYRIDGRQSNIGIIGDHTYIKGGVHLYSAPFSPYNPPPVSNFDFLSPPGSLPPGYRIPFFRNKLFTGRVGFLRDLAQDFLHAGATSTSRIRVIHGMGGVGKTQLAVEFVYRYGRFFHGVHWLDGSQLEALDSEIAACGAEMCLSDWPDTLPEQVVRTLDTWHRSGRRLVVLDSLEDVYAARRWLARLAGGPICLLITTRCSDWPADLGLSSLYLGVFTPRESHKFLSRHLHARHDSVKDLKRLSKRLGYLPLALELAGRYLARIASLKINAYLMQLNDVWNHPSMRRWRKRLGNPTGHDLDLSATFALSWNRLDNEFACQLFLMAGYCAPNQPIPCQIFEKATDLTADLCIEALGSLTGLGLLHVEDIKAGPIIHPLLSEYARYQEKSSDILSVLSSTLSNLSQEANSTGLPFHFSPLYPHVKAVAFASGEAGLECAVSLWDNLGYYLNMVADREEALEACNCALIMAERFYGPTHPEVATCITTLGWVLQGQGDLKNALSCFIRALEIDESTLDASNLHIARDLRNIGGIFKIQGNLLEATKYIELALKIDILHDQQPDFACDVNSLGWLFKDRGDLPGARFCFDQALKVGETSLGSSHPDIAIYAVNEGLVFKDMGKLALALDYFNRALEIDTTAFGPTHPKVIDDMVNLGWAFKDYGNLDEAARYFEQVVKISENRLGPNHFELASGLMGLGWVLKDLGNLDKAMCCFKRWVEIYENVYGPDSPELVPGLSGLGWVLKDMDSLDEASNCFSRIQMINEKVACE